MLLPHCNTHRLTLPYASACTAFPCPVPMYGAVSSGSSIMAGSDANPTAPAKVEVGTQTAPSYRWGLWRVVLAASAATLCNVAFGYDVGVVSGSLDDMALTLKLNTLQKEVATSGLNFLAGFGAIGAIVSWRGLHACCAVLCCAVLCCATSVPCAMASRTDTTALKESI